MSTVFPKEVSDKGFREVRIFFLEEKGMFYLTYNSANIKKTIRIVNALEVYCHNFGVMSEEKVGRCCITMNKNGVVFPHLSFVSPLFNFSVERICLTVMNKMLFQQVLNEHDSIVTLAVKINLFMRLSGMVMQLCKKCCK